MCIGMGKSLLPRFCEYEVKIAFSSQLQAEKHNFFISYSQNLGSILLPVPVEEEEEVRRDRQTKSIERPNICRTSTKGDQCGQTFGKRERELFSLSRLLFEYKSRSKDNYSQGGSSSRTPV